MNPIPTPAPIGPVPSSSYPSPIPARPRIMAVVLPVPSSRVKARSTMGRNSTCLPAPCIRPGQPADIKVRRYDTLRSIARDTLGNPRRADEILEINREIIDNPNHLITGQRIQLPEDADTRRVTVRDRD